MNTALHSRSTSKMDEIVTDRLKVIYEQPLPLTTTCFILITICHILKANLTI